MNRICPNCNKNLHDDEGYFCRSCGHKLDDKLINHTTTFQIKRTSFVPPEKEKKKVRVKLHINKKFLTAFALVLVAAAVSIISIIFTQNKLKDREEMAVKDVAMEIPEERYDNTVVYNLEQPNIVFDVGDLTKYIPFEVDFYIIGSDLLASYQFFWGALDEEGILNDFGDYLSGRYIIFGQKIDQEWQLALVLMLDEQESKIMNKEFLETVESEKYFLSKVKQALVITEYEPFLVSVEESAGDISKNIAHNPKYKSYKTQLPDSGQLLFMSFDNFEEVLDLMMVYSPMEDLLPLINEVKDKQFNKFVVRNNE